MTDDTVGAALVAVRGHTVVYLDVPGGRTGLLGTHLTHIEGRPCVVLSELTPPADARTLALLPTDVARRLVAELQALLGDVRGVCAVCGDAPASDVCARCWREGGGAITGGQEEA